MGLGAYAVEGSDDGQEPVGQATGSGDCQTRRMANLAWHEREQLLLEAIRDLEDDAQGQLQNGPIAARSGLSDLDTALGLEALLDGGFILGQAMAGLNGPGVDILGARLAPAGRVKVRQWPGGDAAQALLEVLDEAFERTDDPEQKSAIDKARGGLRGLAGKVMTEIAVGYGKRLSGLE